MIMLDFGPYMEDYFYARRCAPYIKNFKIDELSLLNNSWFYCVSGDYVKSWFIYINLQQKIGKHGRHSYAVGVYHVTIVASELE